MQLIDGTLIVSTADLVGHLACDHLVTLELGATLGRWQRPVREDPELDLIRRRGLEHEAAYLARLRAEGRTIVEMNTEPVNSLGELRQRQEAALAAMRDGADILYQATLFDGRWRGHPDFLVRVDRPSRLGAWSYEVADAKLARTVKATALLQLCLYSDLLAHLQEADPEWIHVVTGDGTLHRYRLADYAAYYRCVKAGFERRTFGDARDLETYPEPVEHCRICRWYGGCADRRRADDHLSRVANIRRSETPSLKRGGLPTLTALAVSPANVRVEGVGVAPLERLRNQARLQLEQYRDSVVRYELLPPSPDEPGKGLAALPPPSAADVFLDFESDPWVMEGGLEYLLGTVVETERKPEFLPFWAHSREEERRAFEQLVDFIIARLDADPQMHVYHYAPYEAVALKRLMSRHATRADEVDRLLRGRVLVDLYQVVRHSIRVSQESYSLKKVEKLYMPVREGPITEAGFSVVAYERWLETRETAALDEIAAYNRDDCISTWKLRRWLEERRTEAESRFGPIARPPVQVAQASEDQQYQSEETARRVQALTADVPADSAQRTAEQQARWLLAQLLDWHRREAKPEWWAYYDLRDKSDEDLFAAADALAGLKYEGIVSQVKRSYVHRYSYDRTQEHKFVVEDQPIDPATEDTAGEVVGVNGTDGTIDLKRGMKSPVPHPRALIPAKPLRTDVLRNALRRVADWTLANPMDGTGPYRAVRDLLLRNRPRVQGLAAGTALRTDGEDVVAAARRLALALDDTYLPIQGPPGSGKTFTGARMILDLVRNGRRVGISAAAHKAITNLVDAVVAAANEEGFKVRIIQKADEEEASRLPQVTVAAKNEEIDRGLRDGQFDIVAGTPWLFARPELEGLLDVLTVDEAGQMSLANVVVMGGAARAIVLLGDPNQLAQVTQGTHPEGADKSALEHAVGDNPTIPPDRGLFLEETRRLHPSVCSYVSEVFYEGRLRPHASTHRQEIADGPTLRGTGLRFSGVPHAQNEVRSAEEAERVADLVTLLVARRWRNHRGETEPIGLDDIIIVAPYNAQVMEIAQAIRARCGGEPRVGTVDKFQGQEGAVAIYSMAASTAEDAPRGMEFLYSGNRLNVAVSRARALAVLVCSPDLLKVRCRTPEQMRLASALCRFAETSA